MSTNNAASVTTTVDRRSDLAVAMAANVDPVAAGATGTFTIEVTNNGPSDATSVTLTNPAVPGIAILDGTSTVGTCAVASGTLTCPIGNLAVGATASVTVTAEVAPTRAAGPLSNRASASGALPDPIPGNNSASAAFEVVKRSDLAAQDLRPHHRHLR